MEKEKRTILPAHAIVLAAGKGTRMKSPLPKVLHPLGGTPLILHVLSSAVTAGLASITSVLGYGKEEVERTILEWAEGVEGVNFYFAIQEEQLGTGHAVMVAEATSRGKFPYVVVLLGDVPLLKSTTLRNAVYQAIAEESDVLVITTRLNNPAGYGRIVRNAMGEIVAIKEDKDATEEEKQINEINTGIFVFRDQSLWPYLKNLSCNNAQNEYYLTDMVEELLRRGKKVSSYTSENPLEFYGVNSKDQLETLEKLYQARSYERSRS
ncbi:MAG: NTP transferase domain-containing protein [Leptospiraceae bacterium]|nr:NTP transferase domain-containing protein [Leptospiraceae bacterium]